MSTPFDPSQSAERPNPEEPVVRDRRRIDPETGELRQPQPAANAAAEPPANTAGPAAGESIVDGSVAAQSDIEKQLAERTADLQRLQAEYANYRKRVERDREAVAQLGKATVVNELLPLLDDLERAEQHGDLTGPFKAVADKLIAGLQRAGLEPFGDENEPFDPSVHEAVQHATSSDVTEPTVTTVLRRGYRFGDRVLRAALVGVTDHEPATGSNASPSPVDPPVEGELPIDAELVDEQSPHGQENRQS